MQYWTKPNGYITFEPVNKEAKKKNRSYTKVKGDWRKGFSFYVVATTTNSGHPLFTSNFNEAFFELVELIVATIKEGWADYNQTKFPMICEGIKSPPGNWKIDKTPLEVFGCDQHNILPHVQFLVGNSMNPFAQSCDITFENWTKESESDPSHITIYMRDTNPTRNAYAM